MRKISIITMLLICLSMSGCQMTNTQTETQAKTEATQASTEATQAKTEETQSKTEDTKAETQATETTQAETETTKASIEETKIKAETIQINVETTYSKPDVAQLMLDPDLNVYETLSFENSEMSTEVTIYTDAERDSDGNMCWDDGNDFFITARINDYNFILFPREMVQLGKPEVDVFFTVENQLKIVLTDKRSANYECKIFSFDEETSNLSCDDVLSFEAVNYIGSI